jgi:hypothetical protein
MSIFSNIFSKSQIQETLLDQFNKVASPLLAKKYRQLGYAFQLPPTAISSDDQIVDTYREVGTAFHQAATIRKETLSAGVKNRIAWIFMQYREKNGEQTYRRYLDAEIKNYLMNGLRVEYKNELILFN